MVDTSTWTVPQWTPISTGGKSSGGFNGSGPVSALISALGSVWQTHQNQMEAARERTWNEQMMDKQNEFSLDMWNRTNEYNDPSAQLARLRAAGVNPLFSGLDGTGNATALQSAGINGYSRADVQNPLADAAQMLYGMQQMNAQTKLAEAQAENAKATAEGQQIQNDIQSRYGAQTAAANLDKIISDTKKNGAEISYLVKQQEQLQQIIDKYPELTDADIALKYSQAGLNDEQKRVAEATYDKIIKEASWIDRLNAAQVAKWAAETGLAEADLERYDFNHMKTVTAAEAHSMGINLNKFGFGGAGFNWSKYQSTPVLIVPDGDGWKAVGVDLSPGEAADPAAVGKGGSTSRKGGRGSSGGVNPVIHSGGGSRANPTFSPDLRMLF